LELSERLDRTIYRNFGIEYELISSEATGFSLADKVKKIRLLKPLARKIAWKINNEILPSFGYDDVRFQFVIRDTEGDATRASASKTYLITGQRSINEEREQDGYLPIPGGDRRFIMVGKRLIFLDDMANMNSEAIEQTKGGAKEGTTEQKTEQQQSGNEDRSKRQEQPTESTKE